MNESTVLFDMSEFTPYAPIVRNVIKIFLWLFTVWRIFCRLPDIISGAGMVMQDAPDVEAGERKKR